MDFLDRIELAKVFSDEVMRLPVERVEAALADPESAFAPLIGDLSLREADYSGALTYFAYEIRYRFHKRAQAKALPLLRSLLTPKQRRDIRSRMTFEVVGSEGGHYRLAPWGSSITRTVEVNGRRFAAIRYCYHDPESVLCPADVMLGAMLLILTDERGFLAEANPSLTPWFERRIVQTVGITSAGEGPAGADAVVPPRPSEAESSLRRSLPWVGSFSSS